MPSQLTTKLYDGTATNLNDFALHCARDLSLFIELRDEPSESALPQSFTPRSYYSELVGKIEAEIVTVSDWDDKEAETSAQAYFQERKREYDASVEMTKERRQRYTQMREEVDAWQPPTTDHQNLKDYMIRLLEQDMPSECTVRMTMPQPISGRQYKQVRLEELRAQLTHATENRDGDIERNRIRNEWTTELRQSLPEDPRIIGD
jgi:hypothetical protein